MTDALYLGPISLCISLAGVMLAVSIGMTGQFLDRNWTMYGYGVFAAAQIAAIVLGLMSHERLGRATAAVASVLLVASLATLT